MALNLLQNNNKKRVSLLTSTFNLQLFQVWPEMSFHGALEQTRLSVRLQMNCMAGHHFACPVTPTTYFHLYSVWLLGLGGVFFIKKDAHTHTETQTNRLTCCLFCLKSVNILFLWLFCCATFWIFPVVAINGTNNFISFILYLLLSYQFILSSAVSVFSCWALGVFHWCWSFLLFY